MFRTRSSSVLDLTLILLFLLLVYALFARQGYLGNSDRNLSSTSGHSSVGHGTTGTKEERDRKEIIMKVKHIPDARTQDCKYETRGAEVPASLIIDFYDYSFYDMKVTLESVRQFTTESLVREIIIVDDGTTLEYILNDVKSYMEHLPNAMLLRNEERKGQAAARMRAAQEAKGANLIFLDPTVIVSKGWIEPLVAFIQQKPKVIAVPHHDKINDLVTYDFLKTDMDISSSFTWALEVKMTKSNEGKVKVEPIPSATIRGNVFAVTKEYFTEIGGLDVGLGEGGGDALELSFRTWRCGGNIQILPCSRVGILNLHDTVKITSNRNKWRLIQLWLKDYENIIHGHLGRNLADSTSQRDVESLNERRTELSKLKCQPMSWYIDAVARDLYVPPADAKQSGLIQIQNGRCARVAEDSRIDLGSCSAEHHNLLPRDMVFTLTKEGYLKWGSTCLSVQPTAYVLAEACQSGNEHQLWKHNKDKQFINKWSSFCMVHVTDPDPKKKKVPTATLR